MKEAAIGYGCLAVSVVVHGFLVFANAQPAAASRRPLVTELVLAPPTPLAPSPPPAPPEAVNARRAPSSRKVSLKIRASQPLPSPAEPERLTTPPEPELTGRTLATAGDASWSAPPGNGAERGPALGVSAGASAPRSTPVVDKAAPRPIPVTEPFAELSRKPAPPSLTAALERNYPPAARRRGKGGDAKVRALIDAHGRATSVTVSSESSPGFGEACQRSLLQSQWTPPLGAHGEPTATFVSYRCRFQVGD